MHKTRLNRISNRNLVLKRSLLALGAVFVVCLMLIAVRVNGFYQAIHTDVQDKSSQKKQTEEKTEYTFLLLGYGGGSHEGTYLTDTIMVANINIKTKRAILISLPRDMWVKVPTTNGEDFHSKINALYQMGMFPKKYPAVDNSHVSEENPSGILKKAVEDITGLKIDAFAAIDLKDS
jgi:anionic cell wall polymer biosynthesis LytR-Cps2A-Psr (LCP) family protein